MLFESVNRRTIIHACSIRYHLRTFPVMSCSFLIEIRCEIWEHSHYSRPEATHFCWQYNDARPDRMEKKNQYKNRGCGFWEDRFTYCAIHYLTGKICPVVHWMMWFNRQRSQFPSTSIKFSQSHYVIQFSRISVRHKSWLYIFINPINVNTATVWLYLFINIILGIF